MNVHDEAASGSRVVVVLAWTTINARQHSLAALLEGHASVIYPRARPTIIRYLMSGWQTWRRVRELQAGDICIVTAPPTFTPVVAIAAARPGTRIVMDSHPGAFGLMGDRLSRALKPLHSWSVRRAHAVLVTTETLAEQVRSAGGRPLIFHEPDEPISPLSSDRPASGVLFPGTFNRDEPLSVVLETAARLPEVSFCLTGDRLRAPQLAPRGNIRLTGWLSIPAFRREVNAAAVVMVLSTERESVMRTAYEAVRAQRPLVVTRTPATETYFPYAWHVDNDPDHIARMLRRILALPTGYISNRVRLALEHERMVTVAQTKALIDTLFEPH